MHSNSYYNQQQRPGATLPSSVEPQPGPDFDQCRMQPPGQGASASSSTSSSSIQTPNLHAIVPGPRTNPHSYAAGYYSNGAGTLTRYHAPSSSDYIGNATGHGPVGPPSTTSGTTAACSTGLLRDGDALRQPCRQGQVDSGPLSGGTACQFSGTQHQPYPTSQAPRQSSLPLSVDAWSSTSNQQHNQQRINLAGYIEQAQHLHHHQPQSQGAVWMAGCAEYRPQVTTTTHRYDIHIE